MPSILSAMLFCPVRSVAQAEGVVADMETRLPIRDAHLRTNTGEEVKTDYRGRFVLQKPFSSVAIRASRYDLLTMKADQFRRDTVFLLPEYTRLGEVVIIGRHLKPEFNMVKEARKGAERAPKTGGISGFDFLSVFDRSHRHISRKQRQREKEILRKY